MMRVSPRKIAVIGATGSGKSVLARTLGQITGIPVYHLDSLYWKPAWAPSLAAEWEALQRQLVQRDAWIMDGMYTQSLSIRLASCDTIIFLDFPRWLTTYRVIKRGLFYHGKTRPDLAPGCPEHLTWQYIAFAWTFSKNKRPHVLSQILKFPEKNLIALTSPQDAQALLSRVKEGLPW